MLRHFSISLRTNGRQLFLVTLILPFAVSCSALRDKLAESDLDDEPKSFQQRLLSQKYKEIDKKTFDAYSAYSGAPKHGYQSSSFRAKRFDQISTNAPKRYNTELYEAGNANEEKKRKWFNFRGQRSKDSKKSLFARGRSKDDGRQDVLGARRYPSSRDLETVLSRRRGGVEPRILNPGDPASGEPSPTLLRGSTSSSSGGLESLLNGP